MFVDPLVKVHETYYRDLLLSLTCCLAYVRSLASSYFSKTMPRRTRQLFSEINILQGSVATDLRCGEICNNRLIPYFLLSITVKELWKSFNILAKLWTRVWCVVLLLTMHIAIVLHGLLFEVSWLVLRLVPLYQFAVNGFCFYRTSQWSKKHYVANTLKTWLLHLRFIRSKMTM